MQYVHIMHNSSRTDVTNALHPFILAVSAEVDCFSISFPTCIFLLYYTVEGKLKILIRINKMQSDLYKGLPFKKYILKKSALPVHLI